jgi:tetratricopeptide (TPR) repeat protein
MDIRKLIFLVFIFSSVFVFANPEDLKTVKESWTLKQKTDSLCNWSWEIRNANVSKSLNYANEALIYAKETKSNALICKALFYKGSALNNAGQAKQALKLLYEALDLLSFVNDKLLTARIYNAIGLANVNISQYDEAIEFYNKAIEVYELTEDYEGIAMQLQNIGVVYYLIGRSEEALDYYLQSVKILEDIDDASPSILANNYTNTAIVYMQIEDLQKALQFFNKAAKIYSELNDDSGLAHVFLNMGVMYFSVDIDSSLYFHQNALDKYRTLADQTSYAITMSYVADVYREKGQFEVAESYYDEAIEIMESEGFVYGEASARIGQGIFYRKTENYSLSVETLMKAMNLAKSIDALNLQTSASAELAMSYEKMNNYKEAVEYHKMHKQYSDSLFNMERLKIIKSLEYSYEYEKKQREIESLKAAQNIIRLRLISFIVILIILILFLAIFIYKQRIIRKKEKLHVEAQRLLSEEKLRTTESELNLRKKLLLNYALRVTEKNNLLSEISERLREIDLKNKREISGLISSIKMNILMPGEREELDKLVQQTGAMFFERINSINPDLTETEKKICVFLSFGFNSKDIAGIMNITSKTIDNYRSSIRKKLKIPEEKSLQEFFEGLL